MSQDYRYTLSGIVRNDQGKGASRRLRRQGYVPAIVYGGDHAPLSIAIKQDELVKNAKYESFFSQIINLQVEGQEDQEVLVRDVQHHAYKPLFQHFDFQRIVRGQDISATIALHFINEDKAPGVKDENGVVSHVMTSVDVICQPRFLPESIEVDMGALHIGEHVTLADLKLPEGVRLDSDSEEWANTFVAGINHPHSEEEVSTEEEDAIDTEASEKAASDEE